MYAVLYKAGSLRNKKKNELRAAGIRISNAYTEDISHNPRYTTNQSTQTDGTKSGNNVLAPNTSTPRTPTLARRRSLSVGSSPIVATNTPSKRDLFPSSPMKWVSKEEKSVGVQAKKYPSMLIDICAEFARQEEEAKKDHEENKNAHRWHPCPKLNRDSTASTLHEATDYSCTSTCMCKNDPPTTDLPSSSTEDSRCDSDHTHTSSFLHLSVDSNEGGDVEETGAVTANLIKSDDVSAKAKEDGKYPPRSIARTTIPKCGLNPRRSAHRTSCSSTLET